MIREQLEKELEQVRQEIEKVRQKIEETTDPDYRKALEFYLQGFLEDREATLIQQLQLLEEE